jgi:beta-lactamase class A
MTIRLDRRAALAGAVSLAVTPGITKAAPADAWNERLGAIERRLGGRLGVLALDTGTGARIGWRTGERFPMCSTFKWLLAAAVLARIDAGHEQADRLVHYGASDVLGHAPVTEAHLAQGALSVRELCAAAVEVSDNGAANLLLRTLGGPQGLTRWLRSIGDPVTRLDRWELALNSSIPGDPRDTTTPDAMVGSMQKVLLGSVLSQASRQELLGWLEACRTGQNRLRAGLPKDWRAGDKTGTAGNRFASTNDLAIAWPPGRAPILIFAYSTAGPASVEAREAGLAEVGRIVGEWVAKGA